MSATAGTDYRKRLLLLAAGAALLFVVIGKKRLGPTFSLWRDRQHLEADLRAGVDVGAEKARLTARLAELNARAGGDRPAEERWRHLVSTIGAATGKEQVQLVNLAPEHVETAGERTLHTLPVTLTGRTQALLAFTDRLEQDTAGVHLASLDLHLQRSLMGQPPKLLATLYLRTIAP